MGEQLALPFGNRKPPVERAPEEVWWLEEDAVGTYLARRARLLREAAPEDPEWVRLGASQYELDDAKREKLQTQCHALYFRDPIAGNIINTCTFYIAGGRGVEVQWQNEQARARWSLLADRNRWPSLSREMVRLTLICGEAFAILFPLGEQTRLDFRTVFPTEIKKVLVEAEDRCAVTGYERQPLGEPARTYAAEDVVHAKINDLGFGLRGRPFLERALEPLMLYREFLHSHLDLARVRSHLPIIRYRKGTVSALPIRALPPPGTVLDAIDQQERWEFPSLNLSSGDAAQEARMLHLYIAAAVSLPEFMVAQDASRANAGSLSVVESVPLVMFRDLQGLFATYFAELAAKAMPQFAAHEKPTIAFPEVDLRNFSDKVRRVTELFRANLMSRRSAQVELGLNPEQEAEWMKAELTPLDRQRVLESLAERVLFLMPGLSAGVTKLPEDSVEARVASWLKAKGGGLE